MKSLFLFALLFAAACSAETTATGQTAESETAAPAETTKTAPAPTDAAAIPVYDYRIVNRYHHDPAAFTQGLLWKDGHLFESTGRNGESTVRKVELETGTVLQSTDIPVEYFGEGLVDWDGNLISLTWRAGTAFIFDEEDFARTGEFSYTGEGWGLTRDDSRLIMSDGSDTLRFLDPETFEQIGSLNVTAQGQPVTRLNELEWIDGEIWANVWQTNAIVRIDPDTGKVTGVINLTGLDAEAGMAPSRDFVLNGIAWDETTGRIFVTGKYWPALFEIELVERTG